MRICLLLPVDLCWPLPHFYCFNLPPDRLYLCLEMAQKHITAFPFVIFILPLIIIFPLFAGIDGIMYAGPIADSLAGLIAFFMVGREFRRSEYSNFSVS